MQLTAPGRYRHTAQAEPDHQGLQQQLSRVLGPVEE